MLAPGHREEPNRAEVRQPRAGECGGGRPLWSRWDGSHPAPSDAGPRRWRTNPRPCPGGAGAQHSPEGPGVAVVPLIAVGRTLVLARFVANAQRAEAGARVRPGGTALTKELACEEGTWAVSST